MKMGNMTRQQERNIKTDLNAQSQQLFNEIEMESMKDLPKQSSLKKGRTIQTP